MIPVSFRFSSSVAVALLSSAVLSFAGDVIKLKSGEKLDGIILSESPTEIKIEVQVTKSIKATKTVPRKDIVELIKATPDQFEAAELAKLIPAKDQLSDNTYQTIITEKLEPFLKKYPASRYKPEVEAIIKTYQEEMAKAKSGARKIEGVWITPAELDWNAYNYEARLRRVEFQELLKTGKHAAAFRILADLEANKAASVETVTALELAKAALPEFERTLDRLILEHPIKLKNRTEGNKGLSPDQLKRVEEAIKQEEADLKLRLDEDKKLKVGVLSYNEYDLKSITDAKASLQKEAARINKLDLAAMKVGATTFQTGLKNFYEKSYLSAQKNFEDAAKVFPKDPFVKERAELSKKAALEAGRAAAEASAAKPNAANAPSPTSPKAGDAKSPAGKTAEPAKTEAGAPVKKTPVAAPVAGDETDPPVVEASSSGLPVILIGGAALLLLILLVVKILAKKKAAAADE